MHFDFVQLSQDGGISIGVTITDSQNTSVGANITILVGQMQQDVSYNVKSQRGRKHYCMNLAESR
jgi:hypothetical protein